MTPTDKVPADLTDELHRLLDHLAKDLHMPMLSVAPLRGGLRAMIEHGVLLVPTSYIDHWRRFGVMPTSLVRDAAYQSKKLQLAGAGLPRPASVEADALAYAEKFLRLVSDVESGDEYED